MIASCPDPEAVKQSQSKYFVFFPKQLNFRLFSVQIKFRCTTV